MLSRCEDVNFKQYKDYGGRGITVCERWKSFQCFLDDMGIRPHGKTLDRIDNNGNYEPGNCRWATRKQQSQNRRYCPQLTANGKTQGIEEWAAEMGINPWTIRGRLKKGWSHQRAVCEPVKFNPRWHHAKAI